MAYENMTYEVLVQRMIDRIHTSYPNLDTREGSIIFNAIAPAALELAIAYTELDNILKESFVNTATREYILLGCEQVGMDISKFDATYGTFKGEFDVEIPIGSRWNCDLYNFTVTEYISKNADDYYEYKLLCETPGTGANSLTGHLSAISDFPSTLNHAELTACLIEGENELTDDEIRTAYYDFINSTASDGNVGQYKRWCADYNGIGNYKIFPLWNGSNTVKVSILSASNGVATDELVNNFQEYLDPCTIDKFTGDGSTVVFTLSTIPAKIDLVKVGTAIKIPTTDYSYSNGKVTFTSAPDNNATIEIRYNGGMGNGVAPIGAFVTVTTASSKPIDVSATVKLSDGYTDTSIITEGLNEYFSKIAYTTSRVALMSVGAAILDIPGVDFIVDLKLNNDTNDIILLDEEIPVMRTGTWTIYTES